MPYLKDNYETPFWRATPGNVLRRREPYCEHDSVSKCDVPVTRIFAIDSREQVEMEVLKLIELDDWSTSSAHLGSELRRE